MQEVIISSDLLGLLIIVLLIAIFTIGLDKEFHVFKAIGRWLHSLRKGKSSDKENKGPPGL